MERQRRKPSALCARPGPFAPAGVLSLPLPVGAPGARRYDGSVAPRSRSLGGRARDQLVFSVVAVLALFVVLRLLGLRSPVSSIFLSVLLTLALNVGLSAWTDARARRHRSHSPDRRPAQPTRPRDTDIRWRDEQR